MLYGHGILLNGNEAFPDSINQWLISTKGYDGYNYLWNSIEKL